MTNVDAAKTSHDLECLKSIEKVAVREKAESYTGCKYVVLSPGGSVILYAKEDSGIVNQVLVGKSRAFEIDVFNAQDKEVIKLRRPYTVGPDKMDVSICGEAAAIVRKEVTFFKPVLTINDASDRPLMRVKGPVSISAECDFELYSCNKRRVGIISRKWRRGSSGEQDAFIIRFPPELEIRHKAAIISTCFLIDFLYYEL